MSDAHLSPTQYRPPRLVAVGAAAAIAAMAIVGLWRGISEELRVGRQKAYLESLTRGPNAPSPAVAFTTDVEALPPSGQQVEAPSAPEPEKAPTNSDAADVRPPAEVAKETATAPASEPPPPPAPVVEDTVEPVTNVPATPAEAPTETAPVPPTD